MIKSKREKKKGITENDLKKLVYKRNPKAHYVVKSGIVTIIKENNHPIQRFFRNRLHFNIPKESTLDLDQYGSYVFMHLDGKTNVYDLGQSLGRKFEGARKYQYTRLVLYLRQLDHQNNLIIKVNGN
ncbi:PqqD family peptide modification chaperone [Limosilactobacillus antri]|uniref:PqqD family peptide modification chaperone n=1 Tax=Limosilactobacillus antri TaxID=227943 RepID=UPI001F561792|nr:PqqD family peptide modification chaperone [Limosilactobacillus antri]